MKILRLLMIIVCVTLAAMPAFADRLDTFINEQIRQRNIPGLSIAVVRDGKVIRKQGYGLANLELKIPATSETVYEIGSISKQFASEAIMLLVEDGKLRLDDPISQYLPDPPDAWRQITIRQVLNHTAGLKDWTEVEGFSYRREYTNKEFIDLVRTFPLQYQPGASWAYTNTGPPLLGMVVERVSGQTYEQFVTARIIKPLGLPSIMFHDQKAIVANRAGGYEYAKGVFTNGEPFRPKVIAPSGGVLAKAPDLALWFDAVLAGRIVKPASLEQMLAPTRPTDGKNVAHGLALFTDVFNGHKFIFHHGSTVGGFGSVVKYFPEQKLTIAVIGNLEDGGWGPDYIIKRIAGHYIPGVFIGTVPVPSDPDQKLSQRFREMLGDIAANRPNDLIADGYAPRISADLRKDIAAQMADIKSFSFLAEEPIGTSHFILDPALKTVRHYRLQTNKNNYYYSFRLYADGKVGFIVTDRD